jgi:ABC-type multidrug transport system ATPase subunit
MKTLSFHSFQVGRKEPLLELGVNGAPFEINPGFYLLVAPNGFGKSTFFQTLSGLLSPLSGRIESEGALLDPLKDVFYMSEYLRFPKYIYPDEWVQFTSQKKNPLNEEFTQEMVKALRLTHKMSSYLGRLSQGERRKVSWLGACASNKKILLLDEPLDGLDILAVGAAKRVVQKWKSEGKIIIISSHQIGDWAESADGLFLIQDKKFVLKQYEPPLTEFLKKIEAYYQI